VTARRTKAALVCLCALLLTDCAPLTPRPAPSALGPPAGFPGDLYLAARARGEPVYVVEPAEPQSVVVQVHRGGTLASLGHEHVLSAPAVRGYILMPRDPTAARTDLYVPLESFAVDDPSARKTSGLAADVPQQDIDATRRNMLQAVLESSRFPLLVIHATCAAALPACTTLDARITLHGVTRPALIPVALEFHGERLIASGRFALLQTDFGITPYSVLGGALRVEDRIDIAFRLEAVPVSRISRGGSPAP
jgi:YceI-like domain